jgi:hypothetical protein
MKDLLPRVPGLLIVAPLMVAVAFGGWFAAGLGSEAVWLGLMSDMRQEKREWDCTPAIARDTRRVHDHAPDSVRARLRTPGSDPRRTHDPLTTCMEMLDR